MSGTDKLRSSSSCTPQPFKGMLKARQGFEILACTRVTTASAPQDFSVSRSLPRSRLRARSLVRLGGQLEVNINPRI